MPDPYENMSPEEKVEAMGKELNELRPLKDQSQKQQDEFKQKEDAWQKEKTDLEQAANPNWQKARKAMDSMKAALKEKGIEVNEEGNVIAAPPGVNIEEIERKAKEAARMELLGSRLDELLSQYEKESAELVRHYFNKLTAGENVNLQNLPSFVKQAEQAAIAGSDTEIKKTKTAFTYSGGQGPRTKEETEGKLDDSTAKEIGSSMGLKFARDEKK